MLLCYKPIWFIFAFYSNVIKNKTLFVQFLNEKKKRSETNKKQQQVRADEVSRKHVFDFMFGKIADTNLCHTLEGNQHFCQCLLSEDRELTIDRSMERTNQSRLFGRPILMLKLSDKQLLITNFICHKDKL